MADGMWGYCWVSTRTHGGTIASTFVPGFGHVGMFQPVYKEGLRGQRWAIRTRSSGSYLSRIMPPTSEHYQTIHIRLNPTVPECR